MRIYKKTVKPKFRKEDYDLWMDVFFNRLNYLGLNFGSDNTTMQVDDNLDIKDWFPATWRTLSNEELQPFTIMNINQLNSYQLYFRLTDP